MSLVISDQALVKQYIAGDESSLEKLIVRHRDRVYGAIYNFTKDVYLTEDLFQEVFIKVVNKLREGKYNEEGKFLPWVLRMAHNLCIDNYRKTKRQVSIVTSEEFDLFEILPVDSTNGEEMIIDQQLKDKVRHLLNELPEEQREVVLLRHYFEFSFKEISELTGVSINTALGRMRYALINLRKVIEEKKIVF
ncbi:MAG: sigma-70 family RNA polymerase sigma factor [Bacteroidota bacterium]|nr:sigma-70 family RNA polymerase sigma factor [Bacteroidota bacterium]MEC7405831.1 sigma-70 family RNA polymerase sigma factor [Bacteroidota bacterium]MEC8032820.1 sigma-70 family RNA polymerase sigma factor [Bacteroidota bacterium]MEC8756925.1 sigma-70 family RNA polymerase sigma factor [Bacteroidota bacterium]MEC9221512.1 sigma-70 family RNA polymerase sigma factor [Bacteroidota bacterium]